MYVPYKQDFLNYRNNALSYIIYAKKKKKTQPSYLACILNRRHDN